MVLVLALRQQAWATTYKINTREELVSGSSHMVAHMMVIGGLHGR